MTIYAAIPTDYKDIRFRSRNEAHKAAFMDILRITWHYEDKELKGNIPDFTMYGDRGPGRLIVESKTYPTLGQFEKSNAIQKIIKGITGTQWDRCPIFLFAECPFLFHNKGVWLPSLGWALLWDDPKRGYGQWWDGTGFVPYPDKGTAGYFTVNTSVGVLGDGRHSIFDVERNEDLLTGMPGFFQPAKVDDLKKAWDKAGDIVQWKKPKRRVG